MILFSGSLFRSGGRWTFTLRKLVEAWKRGETTVLLTPDHSFVSEKPKS